jgi:hypothetical protein
MGIFGRDSREHHKDGSYTDRYNDTHTSLTYEKDGSLRESSTPETKLPFGIGIMGNHQVTRDGDGNITNVQDRND